MVLSTTLFYHEEEQESGMEVAVTIGEVIRTDRKVLGLSLEQLAKKLGIGVATLHRIETGASSPSLDLLEKVALELHRPLASFLRNGQRDVDHRKREEIELVETEKGYSFKVISPYGLIHPNVFMWHFIAPADTAYHTSQEGFIRGYVWVYLLKGKLVAEYDKKIYAINEGDMFYCNGNKQQSVRALTDSEFLYAVTREKAAKGDGNFRKAEGTASVATNIREIIRADRKAMGLSLEQLAKKLGIGVATLHRIEMGTTSPSLDLLLKIALEIHRPLSTLLQDGERDIDHRKSEEIELIETEKDYTIKVISPYGLLDPELIICHVRAQPGIFHPQREEGYEWVYLLKGNMIVQYAERLYALNEGDVFFCNAKKPHEVRNLSDCELIYAYRKK